MENQDEFFEKGLSEILSPNCTSSFIENSPTDSHIPHNQSLNREKHTFQLSDIIVRFIAAIIAVILLIGFSISITLR